MKHVIDEIGGTVVVAGYTGVKPPSVTAWRKRGIPPERCPAIERGSDGRYPCETVRSDVRWVRVADPEWIWHPEGRPLLDVAAGVLLGVPARPSEASNAAA